ncbi:MAG: rane-bound lytic murein transglycosylase [Bacteroidetes bacterium]|nr:rane-bound lytic murein transglycosylase [Bacteroidota bacterium]
MILRIPMIVIFTLALFSGCTPHGEDLARKSGSEAARVQGGSSAAAEEVSHLDPVTQQVIAQYGTTIKRYALEYGFDWRLILAVMKQESRFMPEAESEKGAFGLMQIMPVTGAEVARSLSLEDLSHPGTNIRAGVYYLRKLYDLYDGSSDADRLKLTLASYNAGPGRVYDAQELAAYLQDDPGRWQSVKAAMPLLSKRYETLHRNVWPLQKPRNGWFGGSRQTIAYVTAVVEHYETYKQELN